MACTPQVSLVYDALLGFDGHEFYFKAWEDLYGKSFREILTAFTGVTHICLACFSFVRQLDARVAGAVPCGFMKQGRNGPYLVLNPDDDVLYEVQNCPAQGRLVLTHASMW